MTREFYELEKGAPKRGVWVQFCNVCGTVYGYPAWSQDGLPSLNTLNDSGWRCLSNSKQDELERLAGKRVPLDTCPDCLKKEATND